VVTPPTARPLAGRTVLVTRPQGQAQRLTRALAAQGARTVEVPAICIQPPDSWEPLDAAIRRGDYDWVIFTSANGVRSFWERVEACGRGADWFEGRRVAAIGPETAKLLESRGVKVDLVPDEYVAEALVACLRDATPLPGRRVLLPRAEVARDVLQEALRAEGAVVDQVVAYRTVAAAPSDELLRLLASGQVDAVTFTSSSTVRSFLAMLEGKGLDLAGLTVACIGPITAATAREVSLTPAVVATTYTAEGLVDALSAYYAEKTP